jgi:hypothetical protein
LMFEAAKQSLTAEQNNARLEFRRGEDLSGTAHHFHQSRGLAEQIKPMRLSARAEEIKRDMHAGRRRNRGRIRARALGGD